MDNSLSQSEKNTPSPSPKKNQWQEEKQKRLSRALRENLLKRKQQQRARSV